MPAPKPNLTRTLLLATVLATTAAPILLGQTPAPANLPTFDVVSIKLNKSGNPYGQLSLKPEGDSFVVTNAPMQRIIEFAFNFRRDDLVFGAPDWARNERYDVMAKVAAPDVAAYHALNEEQRRQMLQAIFADRCRMQAHLESREIPAYALVVAKNGPKMQQAGPNDPPVVVRDRDGNPTQEDALFRIPGQIKAQQVPMRSLALALTASNIGRQVIDKTGLTGKYSFTLQWTPDQQAETAPPADAAPSIFTAIQEQLGLKLESAKAPIDALVIDHLERPNDN
jgi:uncharacterized protein (TIGR03435 family)